MEIPNFQVVRGRYTLENDESAILVIDRDDKQVGIGTTNPNYKLYVDGTVKAKNLKLMILSVMIKIVLVVGFVI